MAATMEILLPDAFAEALGNNSDYVWMDDMDGGAEARQPGLTVVGPVGVLELVEENNSIQLPVALAKFPAVNFFVSEQPPASALTRDRERQKP
jgi:predicted nucleic acid-binding protein